MGRIRNLWVLLGLVLFAVSVCDFHVSADVIPSENECRPYIEKAIHELKNVEANGSDDKESNEGNLDDNASIENEPATVEDGNDSKENADNSAEDGKDDENEPSQENQTEENASTEAEQETAEDLNDSKEDNNTAEDTADEKSAEDAAESGEKNDDADGDSKDEEAGDADSKEENAEADSKEGDSQEPAADSKEGDDNDSKENADEADTGSGQDNDDDSTEKGDENAAESVEDGENQTSEDQADSKEDDAAAANDTNEEDSIEEKVRAKRSIPDENAQDDQESAQNDDDDSQENANESNAENDKESQENTAEDDGKDSQEGGEENAEESVENAGESLENAEDSTAENDKDSKEDTAEDNDESAEKPQADDKESQENASENAEGSQETAEESQENAEGAEDNADGSQENESEGSEQESAEGDAEETAEELPEEDLTIEFEIPKNLRPHDHVNDLLGLDAESSIKENALKRTGDVILKELKKVFDNAIHPLEAMYKYRDLSNRHFGDPEIFSKPLVLFMGPWSGGKSTILNYLTGNEYTPNSIRSGAEPSPAYFNILMHGDEPEVLDGTQLAADWTFSGLQKFGQGLMDRLRGQKLPSKLLERVNIVEIPGILEVRKQVSRYFPFNDACQWFIDRADIIFLVYDPSKLDVGPETEAILDQLKGREYQTRILLNKADMVKPEELLRVQGALIWNISPLMSSAQPPVMYTVSLWSHPFQTGAPIRLLQAQERAFLTDLREAIDKRIENKIASARRFAVRIRNHAKMVDCYLTTYYNQKGLFSNKKQVSDKIIEHPQNYNIYEGLSTLTNISRYDLPDPEVYLDFFRLNPLYEFKKLSETCTYFKGCPINKLDIAIAYDLPELVGKYKKLFEQNLLQLRKEYDENCNQTEIDPPVKIINSR